MDKVLGFEITDIINSKCSEDTYVLLNVCFNSLRNQNISIPSGYNRYILGFWFEVFEEDSFLQLYNNNPNSEFIILTDLDAKAFDPLDRCRVINFYHYKWYTENMIVSPVDWKGKKYKLSSLSNRITEFRYYITAKLLNSQDVYLTWNLYDIGADINYIFDPAGSLKRDELLKKTKDRLKEKINSEIFQNDPISNMQSGSHPAYSLSLVNCINETKDVSWTPNFGISPAPYLTEKTWKPLFFGNALIFSGQANTKSHLEKIGFKFNYPWPNHYDSQIGDLERLETILDTIDLILKLDLDEIAVGIRESVEHNQHIILDKILIKWVNCQNNGGLEILDKVL